MEKIKLLLYCCKQPHKLFNTDKGFVLSDWELGDAHKDKTLLNGKIVAECDFEVEEIECRTSIGINGIHDEYTTKSLGENELLFASKIDEITFINYLKGKNGYAIHIENLHIFDRAKRLGECYLFKGKYYDFDSDGFGEMMDHYESLDKAPQNMCRVWVCENGEWIMYILISVRPEWLCLELNGEKTIEVRKKVLKEML